MMISLLLQEYDQAVTDSFDHSVILNLSESFLDKARKANDEQVVLYTSAKIALYRNYDPLQTIEYYKKLLLLPDRSSNILDALWHCKIACVIPKVFSDEITTNTLQELNRHLQDLKGLTNCRISTQDDVHRLKQKLFEKALGLLFNISTISSNNALKIAKTKNNLTGFAAKVFFDNSIGLANEYMEIQDYETAYYIFLNVTKSECAPLTAYVCAIRNYIKMFELCEENLKRGQNTSCVTRICGDKHHHSHLFNWMPECRDILYNAQESLQALETRGYHNVILKAFHQQTKTLIDKAFSGKISLKEIAQYLSSCSEISRCLNVNNSTLRQKPSQGIKKQALSQAIR
jgi:hypothetical protein